MIDDQKIAKLKQIGGEMRMDLLHMFSHGKVHHFGGSLSSIDIVAALYFYKMNYSKELMNDENRDRFIMSKGHSVPAQYVALSRIGLFPKEELKSIKRLGTRLQGHPDYRKTPGIEAPTGSLGMGLSFGNGIALAGRRNGLSFNVFIVMGDGELQEGQVWEAAMTTAHYKLGNICVLVDQNKFQSQGSVADVMCVDPIGLKFEAFGWDSMRCDGHDLGEICKKLDQFSGKGDKPLAIICDTVKGKGISFMENTHAFHNYGLSEEQFHIAEKEILGTIRGV